MAGSVVLTKRMASVTSSRCRAVFRSSAHQVAISRSQITETGTLFVKVLGLPPPELRSVSMASVRAAYSNVALNMPSTARIHLLQKIVVFASKLALRKFSEGSHVRMQPFQWLRYT
eukprot:5031489-Pleurochrysis_carterae.AAC.1